MTTRPLQPAQNGLIASLTPDQQRAFLANGAVVRLEPGQVIAQSGQPIEWIYFPITAVLSVLNVAIEPTMLETAVIGHEGMAPLAAFHDLDQAVEPVIVQVPGLALQVSRHTLNAALTDSPALRAGLHRFSQALFTFASQSSACHRRHSVVERCARSLLTTHDRVGEDEFRLTHFFLAQLLGMRRSSVTVSAETLREAGAISYTRGRIRVADRAALIARCCGCYFTLRDAYDRLLPRDRLTLTSDGPMMEIGEMIAAARPARGGDAGRESRV